TTDEGTSTDGTTTDGTTTEGTTDGGTTDGSAPKCALHQDCLDEDYCTKDFCEKAECIAEDAVCDDSDACTADSCEPVVGCIHIFQGGDGCSAYTELFAATFDDGTTQGMSIQDLGVDLSAEEIPVNWIPDPVVTHSGAGALYFGIAGNYHFDNDKIVVGTATTPAFTLPVGKSAELTFWTFMDVETGSDWDVLSVIVKTGAAAIPIWSKNDDNIILGEWQKITVDLTAFAGQQIAISIKFDSVDPTFNSTTGVIIDTLRIAALPTAKGCTQDEDCNDNVACTEDLCGASGTCEYQISTNCCAVDTDCSDGNSCTIDLCGADNTCQNLAVANPDCCNTDDECNDNNDCTTDTCKSNNLCENQVKDDPNCCTKATECNDNDKCTIDTCKDYMCFNFNTCCQTDDECNDGDDICTVDTCVSGKCKYSYKPIAGCCEPLIFNENFDAYDDDWSSFSSSAKCKWSVVENAKAKSQPSAMYYGDPTAKNYNCSKNSGWTKTPEISIPDKDGLSLEFDLWMHTESSSSYDKTTVHIWSNGKKTSIFSKAQLFDSLQKWKHLKYSLNAFKGKTIQVEFKFDTIDTLYNSTEGVYVDNFKVTDPCE
ncbi:MAG TPA: hypothetical protein EYN66_15990, partial [Myxococcales bacterium]|nr:hypothetical protein [Myxococcales bacterium]